MVKKQEAHEHEQKNTYFINQERIEEMHRLAKQDRLLTQVSFFPEPIEIDPLHTVLDIACGSGGWALELAHRYPQMKVVGIDTSERMIDFDQVQAEVKGLKNVTFQIMDALKPLDFPDQSFDAINARLLFGFMKRDAWPALLQECSRIVRPGGYLVLTEYEDSVTSGYALERLSTIFADALKRNNQSFSPTGRTIGITPILSRMLRETGFGNVKTNGHMLDYSKGMDAWEGFYENFKEGHKLLHPYLITSGATSQTEVEQLYEQALQEFHQPDFCGLWFYVTAWGQKPEKE